MSDKSMWRYGEHARSDAMSIMAMLDDEFGLAKARKVYQGLNRDGLRKFAHGADGAIAEFLGKTESQRPAFMRKHLGKHDEETRVAFLVLAALGAMRVNALLELRDNYRSVLDPGAGYRVTTSALYGMTTQLASIYDYDWPSDLVSDAGLYEEDDDDDVADND